LKPPRARVAIVGMPCAARRASMPACPSLPAAAPKIAKIVGTFITAISTPGRSPSASATFDDARADFASAWQVFLSKRIEADFHAWRDQRDWTARKYALWDAGKRLEPPSYGPGKPAHRFRKCHCGEVFDMHGPDEVLVHVPHITAAERQPVAVCSAESRSLS
jgi:hypothetical protein